MDDIERERERCASIADALAHLWEQSASKIRADGTFHTRAIWPPFKKTAVVRHAWEKTARDIEAAARGLRQVSRLIREGAELDLTQVTHDSRN